MDIGSFVYKWELKESHILLIGPIKGNKVKNKIWEISLDNIPHEILEAANKNKSNGLGSVYINNMHMQIVFLTNKSGIMIRYQSIKNRLQNKSQYLHWLEEGINALPEAFVLYDSKDKLLIANPQYEELYPTVKKILKQGVSFKEITEKAVAEKQFKYTESDEDWFKKRMDFHKQCVGYFEQNLQDGRWIQLSERKTKSGGTTSIRADITLLKQREKALHQAKQQAEETSQSMERFLAVFSHEVRNGLNGLAGLAQILMLEADSIPLKNNATTLLKSTKRLNAVVSDLLGYLRNSSGEIVIKKDIVSLKALFDSIHSELLTQAQQQDIDLSWSIDENVPGFVVLDQNRIYQILTNLISNAIEHTSLNKSIFISARVENKNLFFEVTDKGEGIAQENVERIFDYFFHSDISNPSSTGLGLAICKQLVVAMGGNIGVESELGLGSRFWFYIPFVVAHPPAIGPKNPKKITSKNLRIGVLDDDVLAQNIVNQLIENLGYMPVFIENSVDIKRKIAASQLDILIIDLIMPGKSGIEIIADIKNSLDLKNYNLKIILMTGNIINSGIAGSSQIGIDAFLQKPIFIEQLNSAIKWVAHNEKICISQKTPPVFSSPRLINSMDKEISYSDTILSQLKKDIGNNRFFESIGSAKDLVSEVLNVDVTNFKAIQRYVHRLASVSAQLGFQGLSNSSKILETYLIKNSADTINIDQLKDKIETVQVAAIPVLNKLNSIIKNSSTYK